MKKIFTDKSFKTLIESGLSTLNKKEDVMEEISRGDIFEEYGGEYTGEAVGPMFPGIPFTYYVGTSYAHTDGICDGYNIFDSPHIFLKHYTGDSDVVHIPGTFTSTSGEEYPVATVGNFHIPGPYYRGVFNMPYRESTYVDYITRVDIDDGAAIDYRMLSYMKALVTVNIGNIYGIQNNSDDLWHFGEFFFGCVSLRNVNIGITRVNHSACMFAYCASLTSLDLTSMDVTNAVNMSSMFECCSNLTEILVSRDKWVIPEGCDTTNMFLNCGTDHVTYVD